MTSELIEYKDGSTLLEGYCAYPKDLSKPTPAVLVAHDWTGRNDFACKKADKLAELGYIGFALDMYGKGKIGNTKEEKIMLMQPLMQDRNLLANRMLVAFNTLSSLRHVDIACIGVIGFCFGGLCALDLARTGANVAASVSFHGLLNAPDNAVAKMIVSKILVLHGYDDPMVPPTEVMAFAEEMTNKKANWQLDMYGNTVHAFTNREANDPGFGTVYNKQADTRAQIAMREFLKECFGK